MPSVFLSYRRDDSAGYAGRLRESLEERLGEGRVFRDVDTLEPGQDFVRAIEDRVTACGAFLALIGQEWLDAKDAEGRRRLDNPDDYVRREIAAALERPGLLVIPVLTEGVEMPPAERLPDELRPLSRRHAISLRDESWQADVDRLGATLAKVIGGAVAGDGGLAVRRTPVPGPGRGRPPRRRFSPAAGIAILALVGVAGVVSLLRRETGPAGDGASADSSVFVGAVSDSLGAGTTQNPAGPGAVALARPLRIEIPRVSEIAVAGHLYSLLWASVTPRGDVKRLRLRFRFVNEGPYDAAFSASSFRLAGGGQVLAPVDGPQRVVPAQTIEHDAVTFDLPPAADRVTLRVLGNDEIAELPLDLTPIGFEEAADTADPGDAFSRAITSELAVPVPDAIVAADGVRYTLTRATMRRFVNCVRIFLEFRFENESRYSASLSSSAFRLRAGDASLAPLELISEAVPPEVTRFVNVLFDVPPDTRRATLRVRHAELPAAERFLDIPADAAGSVSGGAAERR